MVLTLGAFSNEDHHVTIASIRAWTAKDPILARVKGLVLGGWLGDTNLCEFGCFRKHNGIRHIRCAPYHPSSNGLAEHAVQTFEEAMRKMEGVIVAQAGLLSYSVHLDTGVKVKRHVDHVKLQGPGQPVEMEETEGSKQSGGEGDCTDVVLPPTSRQGNPAPETPTEQEIVEEGADETPVVQDENVAQRPELRRSSRPHHPPDRLTMFGEKCSGQVTCHNDVILQVQR
eukprot:Em0001g2987a